MTWGVAAWGVASIVIVLASSALAQPSGDAVDASGCFERRQYDACFREGKRRYGADDYDGAREAYLEGWTLQRNYEVAGNLGNVQLKLGDFKGAYIHLKYSLERLPPSQRGTEVEERLRDKLEEALERIGARRITIEPPDATVRIDGAQVGIDTELWVALDPGKHDLVVERDGYEGKHQLLDVRAGSEEVINFTLARKAKADLTGRNDEVASSPSAGIPTTRLAVGISGTVLGAGGVVAAAVLGVVSAKSADEVQRLGGEVDAQTGGQHGCGAGSPIAGTSTCDALAAASADKATYSGAAIAAGVAGGALLIGSIVYLILPAPDEADVVDAAVTVYPWPGGLTVWGRF